MHARGRHATERFLDIADLAESCGGEPVADIEHPLLAVLAVREVRSAADRGDHVARTGGRLRGEPALDVGRSGGGWCAQITETRALAIARGDAEAIAAIHLVDDRERQLAGAREPLAHHRLARIHDDDEVTRLGLAPARQVRSQREHRGRARVGGHRALGVDHLGIDADVLLRGELLVRAHRGAAGERPGTQLGVAIRGAVIDDDVAARHEAALGHAQRRDVRARRVGNHLVALRAHEAGHRPADLDIDAERIRDGRAIRRVRERVGVLAERTVRRDDLRVRQLDGARPLRGDRIDLELEATAALPVEHRGILPATGHPDDLLGGTCDLHGRGLVDHALPDLLGARLVDERAFDVAAVDIEREPIDLRVGGQRELVVAFERLGAVIAERLGDLGACDRADDADLDVVLREREVPVAIALLARLVRAQRAEARSGVIRLGGDRLLELGPGQLL